MPIEVTCGNPSCNASYVLVDDLAGCKFRCRNCQSVIQVPGTPRAAAVAEGAAVQPGDLGEMGEKGVVHPSRQTCPHCGANLGVRAYKYCPKCDRNLVTGKTRAEEEKKGLNWKPIAVATVLLILIGGAGYAGWTFRDKIKALFAKKQVEVAKVEEKAPEVKERPKETAAEAIAKEKEREKQEAEDLIKEKHKELTAEGATVTEAEASALSPEEMRVLRIVQDYWKDLVAALNALKPEVWAELYKKAKSVGLDDEAQRCWVEVVKLNPKGAPVNREVGRTVSLDDQFVTPEQAEYLKRLSPTVTIANTAFDTLDIDLGGQKARIGLGASQTLTVSPGPLKLVLSITDPQTAAGEIALAAAPGTAQTVRVRSDDELPQFDAKPLAILSTGFKDWTANRGFTDQMKLRRGWRRTPDGSWAYDHKFATGETVSYTFRAGANGNLTAVTAGEIAVKAGPGGVLPDCTVKGRLLTITGLLAMPGGQVVLEGTAEEPIQFDVVSTARPATLVAGLMVRDGVRTIYNRLPLDAGEHKQPVPVTYSRERRVKDEVWRVVALEYPAIAEKRNAQELAQAQTAAEDQIVDLEADGKILGQSSRDDWMDRQLVPVRERQAFQKALDEYVRTLSIYRDRLAWARSRPEFAKIDPVEYQFLNWYHFVDALGEWAAGATELVRERLVQAVKLPEEGAPGAEAAQPAIPSEDQIHEALALFRVAPSGSMMMTLMMLERVGTDDMRKRVIRVYETLATQQAALRLASIAKSNYDINIRVNALLALGRIGRDYALQFCRTEFVEPATRAAKTAALVLAGDKTALVELPDIYAASNLEAQKLMFDHLSTNDSVAQVLALMKLREKITDPAQNEQIAVALARHGGLVAVTSLAEVIRKDQRLYVQALRLVPPQHTTPLIRALKDIMRSQSPRRYAAAIFMGMSGNPLARDHLALAAQTDKESFGTLGLALLGTPESLKSAAELGDKIDLVGLRILRRLWQPDGVLHPQWTWRDGIDRPGAVAFLRAVCAKNAQPSVRLGASFILAELGETPDRKLLFTLAAGSAGAFGAAPAPGSGPGPDPRPGPEAGPEGGPAAPSEQLRGIPPEIESEAASYRFIGPSADEPAPAQPVQTGETESVLVFSAATPEGALPFGRELAFGEDPRLFAMALLDRYVDASVAKDLQDLALNGETVELRVAAMRALGKIGDADSLAILRHAMSQAPKDYASLEAMIASARQRAGAARALARAGEVRLTLPRLLSVLKENPPEPALIGVQAAPAPAAPAGAPAEPGAAPAAAFTPEQYDREASRWRAIMAAGLAEAIGELCQADPDQPPGGLDKALYVRLRTEAADLLLKQAAYPGKGYAEVAPEEKRARRAAVIALGQIRIPDPKIVDALRLLADPKAADVSAELRQAALEALLKTREQSTFAAVRAMIPTLMADSGVRSLLVAGIPAMLQRSTKADLSLVIEIIPFLDAPTQLRVAETMLQTMTGATDKASAELAPFRLEICQRVVDALGRASPAMPAADRLKVYRIGKRLLDLIATSPLPACAMYLQVLGDNPEFGNEALVALAARKTPYPVADKLLQRVRLSTDPALRRGALSALRSIETDAAYDAIRDIMLGPPDEAAPRPAPGPEGDTTPAHTDPDLARLAARMLGKAGKVDALKEAWKVKRRDGTRVYYRYPAARPFAIYGLAYLPLDTDPLKLLTNYKPVERDQAAYAAYKEATDIVKKRMAAEARKAGP